MNNHDLFHAVENNDVDRVREQVNGIVRQGDSVDIRDRSNRTPLLVATYLNHIKPAAVLINAGADVNAKDEIEDSPFLYAGAEGRLEILRLTLQNGADLSSVNRYGGTALIPAAHHGHVETVRTLLKTTIDVDHVNNLGWTALLEAIILGDGSESYVQIVEELLAAGADHGLCDANGVSPLQHSMRRHFSEIADRLRYYESV